MTEQLKPCPFCGGEACIKFTPDLKKAHIWCQKCKIRTKYMELEDAIETWNKIYVSYHREMDRWIK